MGRLFGDLPEDTIPLFRWGHFPIDLATFCHSPGRSVFQTEREGLFEKHQGLVPKLLTLSLQTVLIEAQSLFLVPG
jgi:hypothetical protein